MKQILYGVKFLIDSKVTNLWSRLIYTLFTHLLFFLQLQNVSKLARIWKQNKFYPWITQRSWYSKTPNSLPKGTFLKIIWSKFYLKRWSIGVLILFMLTDHKSFLDICLNLKTKEFNIENLQELLDFSKCIFLLSNDLYFLIIVRQEILLLCLNRAEKFKTIEYAMRKLNNLLDIILD